MKTTGKYLLYSSILVLVSGITWALKAQQVPEKEINIRLTIQELNTIYTVLDDAALPGQIRKPLLQKLATFYNQAMAPTPQKDTTKPKKN